LLAIAMASSCGRSRPVERMAFLPFENLSGDESLDWISSAAPGILRVEMTGALNTVPVQVDTVRDTWTTRATEICYGYFSRAGAKLRLEIVVQDSARSKTVSSFSAEGPLAGGLLPLLDPIAHRMDKRVRPLGTHSQDAIEQWGRAMAAPDPQARAAAYEKVVADDGKFGPGYVGWAQALLAAGDRAGATRVIGKARDMGALLDDVSRAEMDLLSSNMTGDRQLRHEALVTLSRLTQHDVFAVRSLAEEEFKARHFTVAADLYRKASGLDPEDAALLNSFGYAQAFARDLPGATSTLKDYAKQPGQQANGLDSLGEVHYFLGKFADAETYFLKAQQANAALLGGGDLLKAAEARLMTGDRNGADGLFRQYADFRRRSKDPNVDLESARWEYRTGRRSHAVAHLESFTASGSGDAASLADAQLVIWYLEAGDTARAAVHAGRAADRASSTQMRSLAAACKFLVAPSTLAGMPKPVQAISLLLSKRFSDAVPILKEIYG
ncbi:MAG: tetratricopeptide repeat protein, partial [Bryobacteraceae bacterium]